jgi:DNA-binding response OmpR family regulator
MLLASQAGTVATYDRLFSELGLVDSWKSRQALRTCVFGLRRKIERKAARPQILLAEAGVGYRLAASMEWRPYRGTDPPAGEENWGNQL